MTRRRRAPAGPRSSNSDRSWTLVQFDLSDDELGYLLERGDTLYAVDEAGERRVPAFRSREAALSFVRDLDPNVDAMPNGGFYDLRAVEAFVDRRTSAPPPASLDVWSLLGEVAAAARRGVPAFAHAALPMITEMKSSLIEPLRTALASGLDVFRDVVVQR